MNFKEFFKKYKEGLGIGSVVGFIVAYFLLPDYSAFLGSIMQTNSMIDVFQGAGTSAIEWAKTKTIILFVTIGAFLGTVVDMIYTEGGI